MRRMVITTIAAAALAAAGCGSDTAQNATDAGRKAADQGRQAAQNVTAEGLAASTEKLADQVAQAARKLAKSPDADVDAQLSRSEQRANELSRQAQGNLKTVQPQLAAALRQANERLAATASALREADSAADVRNVLQEQLTPVADQLSRAAEHAQQAAGGDTQRQLDKARDQIQKLSDELPSIAG